jgi:lysozyme
MNEEQFAVQISLDEGKRLMPYKDTRGYLTVGVGHLVRPVDNVKEGQAITDEKCQQLLNQDIDAALLACHRLIPTFDTLPEAAQQVLANMAFNLGELRLRQFVNMLAAAEQHQWLRMVVHMRESAWYYQVTHRAQRLINEIMTLVPTQKGLH